MALLHSKEWKGGGVMLGGGVGVGAGGGGIGKFSSLGRI